jgi:hypothetical protein
LEPPKLIVSVTGGAKRLMMKPRLMSSFKRGLINTVTAAGDHTCFSFNHFRIKLLNELACKNKNHWINFLTLVCVCVRLKIDAWIITGGMKAGVMEIVGETILDYMMQTGGTEKRITALGVASWGYVANKQVLVSPDVSSRKSELL